MNPLVENQLMIFLFACALGALIGVLYDTLRIIRRVIKHSKGFVGVEDLLFFTVIGLLVFQYV